MDCTVLFVDDLTLQRPRCFLGFDIFFPKEEFSAELKYKSLPFVMTLCCLLRFPGFLNIVKLNEPL